MPRVTVIFVALLGAACSTEPSDSHIPQLGRYEFNTTIAGAAYRGTLTITAATEAEISYSIAMINGTTESDTSIWTEANGYVVGAHANGWSMLPHLNRVGSTYECYGAAVFPSTAMTCTWTYLGP